MADAEPRPKRSRFDQTEPEPRRTSRFDRRSRSPPSRKAEPGRDRSPLPRADDESKEGQEPPAAAMDPAAAAAAAAAKINAQLQARKVVQNADALPTKSTSTGPITSATSAAKINGEMYVADGDYIKDIEVNDLRNRYLLTKSATQKMIKEDTGADVTTRGNYYPDKSMATPANPPLYLHVTSTSKEGLEAAVAKIEDLMKQELPQLVDERRFRRREEPVVERDEYGRRKWPEERIPIALEPVPGFNLRAQVVGHGGSYVKHIQQETGCRVQIKGRGSGFLETATGKESEDEMFLHVAGPDAAMVEKGKEMCEDLLASVKEQYEEFKARPPRFGGDRYGGDRYSGGGDRNGGGERYGGDRRGGDRYGGGDRQGGDRGHHGGYGGHGHGNGQGHGQGQGHGHGHGHGSPGVHGAPSGPSGGGHGNQGIFSPGGAAASPAPAAATGAAQATPDYSAAYAQYYGGQDPYAAYGGYAAYVQMYQQYYAAQAGQQGSMAAAPGAPGAPGASLAPPTAPPPPPPPSDAAPPPPPPPGPPGASGGYSAVPPPPGL